MQQVQQRETPERMSWARAMIFGVGFFFLAAILVGQLPSYIFNLVILIVGAAMIFYSVLALREQRNPDRSDPGTTPVIRGMIIAAIMVLIAFMVFYALVNDQGLAYRINPGAPAQAQVIIDTILDCVLGVAIFLTLGAFALRLHYLMRPVRKRTMSPLYAFGALE